MDELVLLQEISRQTNFQAVDGYCWLLLTKFLVKNQKVRAEQKDLQILNFGLKRTTCKYGAKGGMAIAETCILKKKTSTLKIPQGHCYNRQDSISSKLKEAKV